MTCHQIQFPNRLVFQSAKPPIPIMLWFSHLAWAHHVVRAILALCWIAVYAYTCCWFALYQLCLPECDWNRNKRVCVHLCVHVCVCVSLYWWSLFVHRCVRIESHVLTVADNHWRGCSNTVNRVVIYIIVWTIVISVPVKLWYIVQAHTRSSCFQRHTWFRKRRIHRFVEARKPPLSISCNCRVWL